MEKYNMPLTIPEGGILDKIFKRIRKGACVLEFGCAYGRMTKHLKDELGCEVYVVELFEEAFNCAKQFAVDGVCGDIEALDYDAIFNGVKFDYIIFADVLEHLRNPEKVLTSINSLLKDGGEIIISMPNIGHNDVIANLYKNSFNYTSVGLLDDSHVHFLGKDNVENFAKNAGYDLLVLDGDYAPIFATEQKFDYLTLPSYALTSLLLRDYNDVYQFFVVLKKQGYLKEHNLKTQYLLENHCVANVSLTCVKQGIVTNLKSETITLSNGENFTFICENIPQNADSLEFSATMPTLLCAEYLQVETNLGKATINLNEKGFTLCPAKDISRIQITANARLVHLSKSETLIQIEENQRLKDELSLANERLTDITTQIESTSEQLKTTQAQLANANGEVSNLRQQNAVIQSEYAAIVNSQSYKITKPIRWVLDGLKKTKTFSTLHKGARYIKNYGLKQALKKVKGKLFPKKVKNLQSKPPKNFEQMITDLKKLGATVYNDKVLTDKTQGKKILFISHEFDLTGAPIALQYFIKTTKEQGNTPVVISPNGGDLTPTLIKNNFTTVIYDGVYDSNLVPQCAELFDLIVINTIVGAPLITVLNGIKTPVIWWIHEAEFSYNESLLNQMPQLLPSNVHVYCVGNHAKKILLKHRKHYGVKELLYCVPDFSVDGNKPTALPFDIDQTKTVFTIVGAQEERKGQDVLVDAILLLDKAVIQNCQFVFVGRRYYEPIYKAITTLAKKYPENVKYAEKLEREQVFALYQKTDCLVCSSLDDPMPIVVTEAMLASKAIICSENTGSAGIIEKTDSGFIYRNNSPQELANCISRVIINKGGLDAQKQNARKAYESYFSERVFSDNVKKIMDEIITDTNALTNLQNKDKGNELAVKVSVVIPTYNAGGQMQELLSRLNAQKGVDQIEINVVDSGSKDGTPELCRKNGANVIEITQAEFSHSFARNLGAQNSTGDVIIFMTQDALPIDDNWAFTLVSPIVKGQAVAVSCTEQCPEGTELYYKIASRIHASFTGITQTDRLNLLEKGETAISLRKKASLSDVTTAINAEIFHKFLYRFSFAEDLDMGVRLLKAGYPIKLTQSTKSVHGHNRVAGYNLKRAFVEGKTFKYIIPELAFEPLDQAVASRMVVYSAKILSTAIENFIAKDCGNCDINELFNQLNRSFDFSKQNLTESNYLSNQDKTISEVIEKLTPYAGNPCPEELNLFNDVLYYVQAHAKHYILENYATANPLEIKPQIVDCVIKQFCAGAGILLSRISEEQQLGAEFIDFAKGV